MNLRSRFFSSKRGSVVMLGLLLLMLIVPPLLFFNVREKADLFDQSLGERDFAVLAASSTAQAALTYLDQSAGYAAHDAYLDFFEQGGLASLGTCTTYRGSSVLFFEGTDCFPNEEKVNEVYATLFNHHLDLYLQNYPFVYFPRQNYVLALDGTTLQGLAQKPLVLPIISSQDVQLTFLGTTPLDLLQSHQLSVVTSSATETDSVALASPQKSCTSPTPLLSGKSAQEQLTLAAKLYGSSEEDIRSSLVSYDFFGMPVVVNKAIVPALTCVSSAIAQCPEAKTYAFSSLRGFSMNEKYGEDASSLHTFGIALDLNAEENPSCGVYDPKQRCPHSTALVSDLPECVIDAFKHAGFSWGGDDPSHPQPMHFVYTGTPSELSAQEVEALTSSGNSGNAQASVPSKFSRSCEQSPVTIIGNSHMVGLKHYLKKTSIQHFYLMEDRDSTTVDTQNCKTCDPFSYVGRNLADMNKRITQSISEMNARGSTVVIVYEGPNSYWMTKSQQKKYLKSIVTALHNAGKTVYLAEMPLGVVSSTPTFSKEKVLQYNAVITDSEIGADGIIHTQNVPWKKGSGEGQLHGYVSGTFPYFLSQFDSVTRVSQASCSSS